MSTIPSPAPDSAGSAAPAICVYCASGPVPQRFIDLAAEVGTAIAKAGYGLVTGGGSVSMMGAVADAARAGGAHTVGIIPEALLAREVADVNADELLVTDTMRQRKQLLDERSQAFIALPGGIGTLEELFEVWTANFLGMSTKPITVLDPFGHYDGLFTWLGQITEQGFVGPGAAQSLARVTTIDAALDRSIRRL